MSSSTQVKSQETSPNSNKLYHQIVVVGGGAGGITVTAQLLNQNKNLDIAIIEPSDKHYYQPAWTLVGAGNYQIEDTEKNEKDCIPSAATWIKAAVEQFDPENNLVITKTGQQVGYEYLIVCPGIQLDWHLIKGLKEAIGKDGVTSNYGKEYAPYTWETIKNFQGGNAIFTYPATPIKCAGAPQKIMYLADDAFRKQKVRNQSNIIYCTAGATIFAVPQYGKSLEKIIDRKNIQVKYQHNLKEIKAESKEAIFAVTTEAGVKEVSIKYDLIHVTPPMSAPDFIKNSPLAVKDNSGGWVDVDKYTLQHNVFKNVFSLGDASSLPTSKTAAAIRKEAPTLVENLLSLMESKELNGKYNGYACCPLVTGYGKTIMAEFDYEKNLTPSFPLDPTKERYSMWLVKRYVLPWLYWNRMLKGKAFEGDMLKFLHSKS
ncbi:MAG: NAD(P)/FAD-dependent oxidoreductase [Gomphosphaeria aponina SAG 52.96 = DSM 107014]|uniref:NAD(P)/FAD-dependent oxidoreductase n=1 Tax=Gomphosphaeria aponina SAG 52.96 = DSM 107014 TaxID=1521640 RepID=A0A941GMR9_9CHRO|nr:NAD(P)/FAD-dependent oxidoreductase [Gomphosphaeria aponina SAG 52.96 = DSM 107014]